MASLEPRALLDAETGKPVGYYCPQCKRYSVEREGATSCCSDPICHVCGGPSERRHWACGECQRKAEEERAAKRLAEARVIDESEYDGHMLYSEDHDAYYPDVATYLDHEYDEPESHLWACREESLSLGAESIIENALTEHHEDARDELRDGAEADLQAMLDAWCAKQHVRTYFPDYSVAVRVEATNDDL